MTLEPIALAKRIIAGDTLTEDDAFALMAARGAQLSAVFAGAHLIKENFFSDKIELCSIINAKSGRCNENCAFCAQSAHHHTDAPTFPLKSYAEIIAEAKVAADQGSHCFGIVTSGTRISEASELTTILTALREIKDTLPIDPSASLGILSPETATQLAAAGCVTYHHNLETARSFFPNVCTTHAYDDDIETVRVAKAAGMQVCCGGILGLGESVAQRIELAFTLRELDVDSVPLNFLNPIAGTPLQHNRELTPLDCLRIVALFRYTLPRQRVSVCGGREPNLRDFQSWITIAGASGAMIGNYLTTSGRDRDTDLQMFRDAEVTIDAC